MTTHRIEAVLHDLIKTAADPAPSAPFLQPSITEGANWLQGKIGSPSTQGAPSWGDTAGKFWGEHGGKVMGGLGGLALGAGAGQLMKRKHRPGEEDEGGNGMEWLMPLLGAGAGVAGGHYLYDNPEAMAWLKSKFGGGAAKPGAAPAAGAPMTPPAETNPDPGLDMHASNKAPGQGAMAKLAAAAMKGLKPVKGFHGGGPLTPTGGQGGQMPNNAGTGMSKQAGDINWSDLWEKNKGKIIGGGAGALLGGAGGAALPTGEGEDDHRVRNGTLGSLAGLAAGVGGGALADSPEAMAKLKAMFSSEPKPKTKVPLLDQPEADPLLGGASRATAVGGGTLGGGAAALGIHRATRPAHDLGKTPRAKLLAEIAMLAGGGTAGGLAGNLATNGVNDAAAGR